MPTLVSDAPVFAVAIYPLEPWSIGMAANPAPVLFLAIYIPARTLPMIAPFSVGVCLGRGPIEPVPRVPAIGFKTAISKAMSQRTGRVGGATLVALAPGFTSSLVGGIVGLPMRLFAAVATVAVVVRGVLVMMLADAAQLWVLQVVSWLQRWQLLFGVGVIALWMAVVLPARSKSDETNG
jgi:hypothetical protein